MREKYPQIRQGNICFEKIPGVEELVQIKGIDDTVKTFFAAGELPVEGHRERTVQKGMGAFYTHTYQVGRDQIDPKRGNVVIYRGYGGLWHVYQCVEDKGSCYLTLQLHCSQYVHRAAY